MGPQILTIYSLLVVVLSYEPVHYPIKQSDLVPCGGDKSLGLCRPPANWTSDLLGYISQLDIRDPYFYDVFDEAEIYNWFRPRNHTLPIPFYIWEDEQMNRDVTTNVPSFLQDLYATFLQDLRFSPWRTRNVSEAIAYFVAIPWAPWVAEGSTWQSQRIPEFINKIVSSPPFHQHNGSNFFYITSGWQEEYFLGIDGHDLFQSMIEKRAIVQVPPERRATRIMGGIHYGSFPVLRSCTLTSHYSASEQLRSQRSWPAGSGESYRYPLGHFAQMLRKRPHKYFFSGQADNRYAYSERRVLLSRPMPSVCASGVLVRTGHGPDELEKCSEDLLCQCVAPHGWPRDAGSKHLMDSVFAFHIRGDDFYSARIADIVAAGTIPIVVDKVMYGMSMSGQCNAPWREMAIYLNVHDFNQDPEATIKTAVESLSHQRLEKMARLLYYYQNGAINGKLGQSRVGEDRIGQFVLECLSETDLLEHGISKADLQCEFEDLVVKAAFPVINDEDETPAPWDCLFMNPDACPLR